MKTSFKLFTFKRSDVRVSIWFLLLFFIVPINWVFSIFISVLVHELAHAYVANKIGYLVNGIEIGFFGGSAAVDINNIHEKDSVLITAAGPLSNFMLMIIGYMLDTLFPDISFMRDFIILNMILLIFNIIPIYPMDGGRIFKDILLINMRNKKLANDISSWVSLILASALLVVSIMYSMLFIIIISVFFIFISLQDILND